jgi:AcrR family transcriptional regulator
VVTPAQEPVRRRRRGQELETALLEAAWEELVDVGYASITMESIAARARTGVAVLYRRWANKGELALAAIEQYRLARPVAIPDTGSLRDDLLALLTAMSKARATFTAIAAAAGFSGLLADTGLTPTQLRGRLLGDRPLWRDQIIYRRAHDRGEIDLDRIPPAVLAMPFDLVRHDLLMNLKPLRPARIRSIVDDLFLPLAQRTLPTITETVTADS